MYRNNYRISKMSGKIKIIDPFVWKLLSMSRWPQWRIKHCVGSSRHRDPVQGRRPTDWSCSYKDYCLQINVLFVLKYSVAVWHRHVLETPTHSFLRKAAFVHSPVLKEAALICTLCDVHLLIGLEGHTWLEGSQFTGTWVARRVAWQEQLWPMGVK